MTELPSGRQYPLEWGNQSATVVEVGGGLRTYSVAGIDVVDGYAEDRMCTGGRGQVLAPWPNRLAGGRYVFDGSVRQLAITEPARGNAIHGLVRWSNWQAIEHSTDRVVLRYVLHPQPGYPFTLSLRIGYGLGPSGLAVELEATNLGKEALPYGAGFHPYLTLGSPRIDSLVLQAPGSVWMPGDRHQIPVGAEAVARTPYDFRSPRVIGPVVLDTAYGELERDRRGVARVRLGTEDGSRSVQVWMSSAVRHLMVFTGDTLAGEERRRGLAVEPMTCAPNAFVSGDGLQILPPGGTSSVSWGITPWGTDAG